MKLELEQASQALNCAYVMLGGCIEILENIVPTEDDDNPIVYISDEIIQTRKYLKHDIKQLRDLRNQMKSDV